MARGMKQLVSLALVGVALAACSKPDAGKPVLTQHQKDSILGQSTIPGAAGVQKALSVQDSLNNRTRRADSIGRDTAR